MNLSFPFNPLPNWFVTLSSKSEFRKEFVAKFKKLGQADDETLRSIINIFGLINQNQISEFLPEPIKRQISNELVSRNEKHKKLLKIAFKNIHEEESVDLETMNSHFKLSAFSSLTLEECVINEIAEFLLSLSMPSQESRRSRCNCIPKIKQIIENEEKELEEAVAIVFQSTASNRNETKPIPLKLAQERKLFNTGALKGHGRTLSWGTLLFIWGSLSVDGRKNGEKLFKDFHFHKLLIPEQISKIKIDPINVTFQQFVVQQTLDILFRHQKTFLLPDLVEEELKKTFSKSIRAQQDAIYFIDYLHSFLENKEKQFQFKEAVKVLKALIPDSNEPIYPFLHTSLLFFQCKSKFKMENSEAAFIFQAIHCLKEEEKKIYDYLIEEEFQRKPFQINKFLEYVKTHLPLEEIAHIILKFSVTVAKKTVPAPYMSFEDHIKFLEEVEIFLGFGIPILTIADFLFFQAGTVNVFYILKTLSQIREEIIEKHLDFIAIPRKLYLLIEKASTEYSKAVYFSPKFPKGMPNRLSSYLHKMVDGLVQLQMAVYPRPFLSFGDLIPVNLKNNCLIFSKKGGELNHRLEAIHSGFSIGPAKYCCWSIDPKTAQLHFSVSLLNSLHYPKRVHISSSPLSSFITAINIAILETPKLLY